MLLLIQRVMTMVQHDLLHAVDKVGHQLLAHRLIECVNPHTLSDLAVYHIFVPRDGGLRVVYIDHLVDKGLNFCRSRTHSICKAHGLVARKSHAHRPAKCRHTTPLVRAKAESLI